MIYVDVPSGDDWGLGVCGDSLVEALRALAPTQRLPKDATPQSLGGPLLQMVGPGLRPRTGLSSNRRIAYTFFSNDLAVRVAAGTELAHFDTVAAGSRWCEDVLRDAGLDAVTTVHPGVDRAGFHPERAVRHRLGDRFVIFSGGKFELRKGQDIVAQAFRIFAQRHSDVFLVAAWHNRFPWSVDTMRASRHLPFALSAGNNLKESLCKWLDRAGVDLRRVELVPPLSTEALASLYANSDVGLFPSRSEGGPNLVLMEYMACGGAAIATDFSGHRDILTPSNSFRLRACRPFPIFLGGKPFACYCEPDIDEVVETLEQAYTHRERLADIGRRAATDLADWTWKRTATRFLELLEVAPATVTTPR